MLATGAQSLNKHTIAHIYWSDRVSQGGIQLRKQKEIVYLRISFFGGLWETQKEQQHVVLTFRYARTINNQINPNVILESELNMQVATAHPFTMFSGVYGAENEADK